MSKGEIKHGTRGSYSNRGCRCEECTKAASDYARKYRTTGSGAAPGFGKSHGPGGYQRGCRCTVCQQSAREYHLKNKYGISLGDLKKMEERQGGKCALCEDDLGDKFDLDHCHKTGRVRGLLCRRCNLGLGKFQDSPTLLGSAVKYLETNHRTG